MRWWPPCAGPPTCACSLGGMGCWRSGVCVRCVCWQGRVGCTWRRCCRHVKAIGSCGWWCAMPQMGGGVGKWGVVAVHRRPSQQCRLQCADVWCVCSHIVFTVHVQITSTICRHVYLVFSEALLWFSSANHLYIFLQRFHCSGRDPPHTVVQHCIALERVFTSAHAVSILCILELQCCRRRFSGNAGASAAYVEHFVWEKAEGTGQAPREKRGACHLVFLSNPNLITVVVAVDLRICTYVITTVIVTLLCAPLCMCVCSHCCHTCRTEVRHAHCPEYQHVEAGTVRDTETTCSS